MVHVDVMAPQHMPRVLVMENASFSEPWREEEFAWLLQDPAVVPLVALDLAGSPIGYLINQVRETSIHIHNLAVDPAVRRNHVGSLLVGHTQAVLGRGVHARRKRVDLMIRETNLPGQLFFRALGFKAVEVWGGYYAETSEDAYRLEYRIGPPPPVVGNRIAMFFKGDRGG